MQKVTHDILIYAARGSSIGRAKVVPNHSGNKVQSLTTSKHSGFFN